MHVLRTIRNSNVREGLVGSRLQLCDKQLQVFDRLWVLTILILLLNSRKATDFQLHFLTIFVGQLKRFSVSSN